MTNLINVNLAQQVQEDYLAYSLSVIIGRAIPRYTDGCKPIARRILTAMKWLNLKPDGRFMKSARVEGETMGKLSPHGGSYSSIVTLAAPWNNNLPYVDGHGNWGDSTCSAASARYTECKLSTFAWDALLDNSETWQVTDNYDGSLKEPIELDVKIPAVFINGQEGIGVGLATKIPQHNLRDICDAVVNGSDLYPDFSTGCSIVRDDGLQEYIRTGAGSIRCRAVLELGKQEKTGRKAERAKLTFTRLPLSTNPEKIGEQIKNALEGGKIEGVAEVNDESDMTGDRISVIARPGVEGNRLAQLLYAYTDLDTKFSARTLVIDGTKPLELSAKDLIEKWKGWRLGRLQTQFTHERDLKEERHEVVTGLLKAIDKIDLVIKTIRAANSPREALIELVSNRSLKFTSDQARAILEMKLRSLTNLDSDELLAEKTELEQRLETLKDLIANEKTRKAYMITEIKKIGVRYGEARRSAIIEPPSSLTVERGSTKDTTAAPRPKFLKIDMKKGIVEVAKGPRGAMVLDAKDKLITVTADGTLKKLPANFKGVLGANYSEVKLAKKESDVATRQYLLVFILGDQLKALAIDGGDLCRATSKGKSVLPEGATMVHFGEGSYSVPWVSPRKKKVELFPVNTKAGKPGAKGVKVANLTEIQT
jgi:DNA gyrase subunit A